MWTSACFATALSQRVGLLPLLSGNQVRARAGLHQPVRRHAGRRPGRRPALPQPTQPIRDLATARLRDVDEVAAESARYRARFRFTLARVRRRCHLVQDAAARASLEPASSRPWLQRHAGLVVRVGGLVSRPLSVRNPVSRWLMLALDPLLLLAATVAVAWAFGLRTAFLMVIFIGTTTCCRGPSQGRAFAHRFAMASVLAVCLVKQRYYKIAGVLLGWAILSRIFPGFLWSGRPYSSLCGSSETPRRSTLLGLLGACAATVAWWSWDLAHTSARQRSGTSGTSRFLRTTRTPAIGISASHHCRSEFPGRHPLRALAHAGAQHPALFMACPVPSWPCSCSCPP